MQQRSSCTRGLRTVLAAGLAVGGLVLALVPRAARAQETPQPPEPQQPPSEWDDSYYPFARTGLFLGFGAHYALENFDTKPLIEPPGTLDITADDGGGFEMRGGYRAMPRLAGEVLFQYTTGFAVRDRNTSFDDNFDAWTLTANAKAYPLLGRFQPYATAGVGGLVFNHKKGDDSSFVARLGLGVDLYLSNNFVLDTEFGYLFPSGSLSDYQFATFSVGAQWRF